VLFRSNGFGGYEAHKEDHDRLLEEIRDIMHDATYLTKNELHEQLAQRLNTWLTEHFRTLDRRFPQPWQQLVYFK